MGFTVSEVSCMVIAFTSYREMVWQLVVGKRQTDNCRKNGQACRRRTLTNPPEDLADLDNFGLMNLSKRDVDPLALEVESRDHGSRYVRLPGNPESPYCLANITSVQIQALSRSITWPHAHFTNMSLPHQRTTSYEYTQRNAHALRPWLRWVCKGILPVTPDMYMQCRPPCVLKCESNSHLCTHEPGPTALIYPCILRTIVNTVKSAMPLNGRLRLLAPSAAPVRLLRTRWEQIYFCSRWWALYMSR